MCCSSSAGEPKSSPIGQLTILPYGEALGWQRVGSVPDSSRVIGVVCVRARMPERCGALLLSEQFPRCPIIKQWQGKYQYSCIEATQTGTYNDSLNIKQNKLISVLAVHQSCYVHRTGPLHFQNFKTKN